MATADGDADMVEVKHANHTETEEPKEEAGSGDGVNGSTKDDDKLKDEDKDTGPIGTYAVIPEDPPQEPLGPPNALEKKIIKQLEYYFGDMNLPRDRFLQEQIREDGDGWVSLGIMTKFNRLKQLTSNLKMIATAVRKADSGLLEVSKDGVYMRRSPDFPLPENTEERRSEITNRSVYAKGFPLNISLDKLIAYFEKDHGHMDTVYMRRDQSKKFKGSVFAVFTSQSDADKFLAADAVKFQEDELVRLKKQDYFLKKQKEKKQRHLEAIQRKKEEQKKREAEEREKLKASITRGTILHLTGFKGDKTDRETVKNYFSDFGTIAWIDYDEGDEEGWVRFDGENKAVEGLQAAKDANDGKVVIMENELTGRILEGDEELEHWRKIFRDLAEKRAESKKSRKREGGHWKGPKEKRKRKTSEGDESGDEDDDDDDKDDDKDDDDKDDDESDGGDDDNDDDEKKE